jgi:hypothetical protein
MDGAVFEKIMKNELPAEETESVQEPAQDTVQPEEPASPETEQPESTEE